MLSRSFFKKYYRSKAIITVTIAIIASTIGRITATANSSIAKRHYKKHRDTFERCQRDLGLKFKKKEYCVLKFQPCDL